MFQMGGTGPMFGQLGFFHKFAGKDCEDKRPRDRYVAESRRLLGVLDRHLEGRAWMMGDEYTIADIAIFPGVNTLVNFYGAGDLVGYADFQQRAARARQLSSRARRCRRGLKIPDRERLTPDQRNKPPIHQASAAMPAEAGMVTIHAITMLPATPQRTAEVPLRGAHADDGAGDGVRGRHRDAEVGGHEQRDRRRRSRPRIRPRVSAW